MKLSKAQEYVLQDAKEQIDRARALDYKEWLIDVNSYYAYHEDALIEAMNRGYLKNAWENDRIAIVHVGWVNSRTLRALENLGLIEIIDDSAYSNGAIDTIKILNY